MESRNILRIRKGKKIPSGSESVIFVVKEGYYKEFSKEVSEEIRKRKKAKLQYLDKIEYLKQYYPHIYYLVHSIFNRYTKGYVMEPIIGKDLNRMRLSFEEKITLLDLLESILHDFNEAGIYYHDIRPPNMMLTADGKIILLDIDSITTEEYPELDVIPGVLHEYMENGGVPGMEAQTAMFNTLANHMLSIYYSDTHRFTLDLEGLRIRHDLINAKVDSHFDHDYLHHHIKRLK